MKFAVIFAFSVCGVLGCTDTRPKDNSNAVFIEFFRNENGGNLGDECPLDSNGKSPCDGTPLIGTYYKIADADNACTAWPGNSGENSAKSGTCHPEDKGYSFTQWTDCECGASGRANTNDKHAYVDRCTVEVPNMLCSKIKDYSACESTPATQSAAAPALEESGPAPAPAPAPEASAPAPAPPADAGKDSKDSKKKDAFGNRNPFGNFRIDGGSEDSGAVKCVDQFGNPCDPQRRRLLFGGVQNSCQCQ